MASAGARFESARASGDAAAARAAVEDIVTDAKDPAKRAALASSGAAVSIAAELLRAARAKCWCDAADATQASDASLVPFAPLARALRNVCAGNAVARGGACALPHRAAPEALALAIPALAARVDAPDAKNDFPISDPSSVKTPKKETTAAYVAALAAATQLACNLIAGGGAAADTTWTVLFPRHFGFIAKLRHRDAAHLTHPALCAAMRARLAERGGRPADPHDDSNVCGFRAGAIVWRPLLRASIGAPGGELLHDDDDKHAGVGGGEMLFRFVESFCLFAGDATPPLCRSLAPRAAETARLRDDALRRKIMGMCVGGDRDVRLEIENDTRDDTSLRERFSVEQATLLELVSRAAAAAPQSDPSRERDSPRDVSPLDKNQPPKTLVLSEGTAAYVLDLASRAAEAVERARSSDEQKDSTFSLSSELDEEEVSQADAARVTLRACLGVLRAVTEREVRPALAQTPGDDVASLCAMGMPRLLLGLLASLPVPEGAGNSEKKKKASGPSAAPDLAQTTFLPSEDEASSTAQSLAEKLREGHAPYPSSLRPWDGYRVDVIAPLANAMFGRPAVCDAVYDLGGVPVLLACTRGEDGDEYLREYALWAVRNVCAGSESARLEIEAMQPRAAADAHELAAAGLRVAVDPVTGRVKIGNVENDARNVNRFAKEKEKDLLSGAGSLERGSETVPNGPTRDSGIGGRLMLSGGGERARTPVGRAIQAALEAGLEPTPENDDEDAEVPKHWKIADLS